MVAAEAAGLAGNPCRQVPVTVIFDAAQEFREDVDRYLAPARRDFDAIKGEDSRSVENADFALRRAKLDAGIR